MCTPGVVYNENRCVNRIFGSYIYIYNTYDIAVRDFHVKRTFATFVGYYIQTVLPLPSPIQYSA